MRRHLCRDPAFLNMVCNIPETAQHPSHVLAFKQIALSAQHSRMQEIRLFSHLDAPMFVCGLMSVRCSIRAGDSN